MLLVRELSRFKKMSALERGILIRALLLLPAIGLGLRIFGFKRVQAILTVSKTFDTCKLAPNVTLKIAVAVASVVSIAARRGFYRANCLPTSLVLEHLIQKQGIAADLRVGVRKVAGALEAHAWVEHYGQPLNDGMDVHERFPAFNQPIHPRKRTLD